MEGRGTEESERRTKKEKFGLQNSRKSADGESSPKERKSLKRMESD